MGQRLCYDFLFLKTKSKIKAAPKNAVREQKYVLLLLCFYVTFTWPTLMIPKFLETFREGPTIGKFHFSEATRPTAEAVVSMIYDKKIY